MGLEYVGYTPRNIADLWINPLDYQDELEGSINYLSTRDMPLSIYNHQLCVLKTSLWPYAQRSISDWKSRYLPECEAYSVLNQCGGLFKWAVKRHSKYIHAIAPLTHKQTRSYTSCAHNLLAHNLS
jgi:hypothetical protein